MDFYDLKAGRTKIYDLIREFTENQKISSPKARTGRPYLIGEDTGKKILMEIEEDRFTTARDIFNNKKINHNNVGYGTINNFIN